MTASMPRTVTVGPFRYRICTDATARLAAATTAGRPLLGNCDTAAQTITVDPGQHHDQLCDTLLHEVLHAVTDMVGIAHELSGDDEEGIVRRMAPALLDVLRTNPALVTWLTGRTS